MKRLSFLFKDVKEYNKYLLSILGIFIILLAGIVSYNYTNSSYAKWSSNNTSSNLLHMYAQDNSKPTSIYIKTQPTKTIYNAGDTFDPSGMVVVAKYPNGTEETITDYTYSPSTISSNTASIKILYKDKYVWQDIKLKSSNVVIDFYIEDEDTYVLVDSITVSSGYELSSAMDSLSYYEPTFYTISNPLNKNKIKVLTSFCGYESSILSDCNSYYVDYHNSGSCTGYSWFYLVHPISNENCDTIMPIDSDYKGWALTESEYIIGSYDEDRIDIIYAQNILEWTSNSVTRTLLNANYCE